MSRKRRLTLQGKENDMFCPKCGTQIPDTARFCPGCGNQLTPPANAQRPVAQQPMAQQPMAQRPAAQQPMAQRPAAQQPATQQPAPNPYSRYQATGQGAYAPGNGPMPPRPQKKPNKLKVIIPAVAAVVVAAVVAFFVISGGIGNAGGTIKGGTGLLGSVQAGDTVTFGTYEQDNDTANGQEAIEWQVLDVQGGKALLVSKYALDCQSYNSEDTDITWETCSLRTWMNSDFYNGAFSSAEQSHIAASTLTNEDNAEQGTRGGNSTQDKVFCLSTSEAGKYFATDAARICEPTAYATAQGAVTGSLLAQFTTNSSVSAYNGCIWWLRSPGSSQSKASGVLWDGSFDSEDISIYVSGLKTASALMGLLGASSDKTVYSVAVRPALWVNL